MGLFSRLRKGASAAVAFNQQLELCGVNYRIFPSAFQRELYSAIRVLAEDDPRVEAVYIKYSAQMIAACMTRHAATQLRFFDDPDLWQAVSIVAELVVPLMERHGIPHQFVWPEFDRANAPEWA